MNATPAPSERRRILVSAADLELLKAVFTETHYSELGEDATSVNDPELDPEIRARLVAYDELEGRVEVVPEGLEAAAAAYAEAAREHGDAQAKLNQLVALADSDQGPWSKADEFRDYEYADKCQAALDAAQLLLEKLGYGVPPQVEAGVS